MTNFNKKYHMKKLSDLDIYKGNYINQNIYDYPF